MKELKIKDNGRYLKADFSDVNSIVNRISNKTLEELEREGIFVFPQMIKESDDLTREQMILQSCNEYYLTGNVMGFLGVGDERLVIESRFSRKGQDYFFQYLLEKVLELPNFINLSTSSNEDEKVLDLLAFLFPKYLNAAMRKGLFKAYKNNEYNNENVRGSIDIARHIKKNIPFVGNIAYSQREHSYDNYLTELIRHTIEVIKGKSYGNSLLVSVRHEVKQIIDATPQFKPQERNKLIEVNKKNVVRHAYFHEYKTLQQLCILILQNQKNQFGNGTKRVYGILFDGAWLWEEYVNTLVGDMFYHPMNKAGSGAQRLFSDNVGLIYPDFIGNDSENRIIADAKYKPVNNIGNKDYLQLLAYMFRFEAKRGFYLYPDSNNEEPVVLNLKTGSTYENNQGYRDDISVTKLGLVIPDTVKDYSEFKEALGKAEKQFVQRIRVE